MGGSSLNRTLWGFFVQNDFLRFRELSVTYSLPHRITKFTAAHIRRPSSSAAATSAFCGRSTLGSTRESNGSSGSASNDFFAEPPLRYFIGRINVAF